MVKKRKVLAEDKVLPRSKLSLSIDGEFSKFNLKPKYFVEIHATNKDLVKYEEKLLGSSDHYIVTVNIINENDSIAFVSLISNE